MLALTNSCCHYSEYNYITRGLLSVAISPVVINLPVVDLIYERERSPYAA